MLGSWKVVWFIMGIGLCLSTGSAAADTGCDQADTIFQRSQSNKLPAAEIQMLEQAVDLCPTHTMAWNNLGLAYENEGLWDEAENAYRQAVKHQPGFAAPYAGLGDLSMSQSRFMEAALFYEKFLNLLAQERQKGDPMGLVVHESAYRRKYEQAKLRWGIHQESMTGIVSQKTLSRGFRGIKKVKKTSSHQLQRMALSILFDFDSAGLKPRGKAQLSEVAKTMQLQEFISEKYRIEGHSDTIGDADYNFSLSCRRAEAVRSYLVSRGVAALRLTVHAYGETRPIIQTGDAELQAVNRRVEFVSMP